MCGLITKFLINLGLNNVISLRGEELSLKLDCGLWDVNKFLSVANSYCEEFFTAKSLNLLRERSRVIYTILLATFNWYILDFGRSNSVGSNSGGSNSVGSGG